MSKPSQPNIRAVERAIAILQTLERAQRPMRLKEIGEAVELHSATVSRVLATLQASNYVVEEDQRYRLGAAVLRLTHGYLVNDPLSQFARPIMQSLTRQTGLTSTLHLLSGMERLLSVRVDGFEPMQYQQPIGRWLPLFIGSGKTIAAFLSDAEQEEIAALGDGHVTTSKHMLTADEILADFASIRNDRHLISIGERDTSIASISVPIYTDSTVAGSLSMTGPRDSTTRSQLEKSLPALSAAAEEISRMKSYS
ncbi:MAG: IclR family transcriptional regulator [Brevibacterium sp.]